MASKIMADHDFFNHDGALHFDLLQQEFKKAMPDYDLAFEEGKGYNCINFCSKVLFQIGPESRNVKPGQNDKLWVLNFNPHASTTEKVPKKDNDKTHTIVIATCKTAKAESTAIPRFDNFKIFLTVKQASLLAMKTFLRLTDDSYVNQKIKLFTPLCGAIFYREDVPEIAEILFGGSTLVKLGSETDSDFTARKSTYMIQSTLKALNSSCQPYGQLLPESDINVAVVATGYATKYLEDKKLASKIFLKTVEQYRKIKKNYDIVKIEALRKFANGGVPEELSFSNILQIFKKAQGGQE